MEYYTAVNTNQVQLLATTWMNVTNIKLRKRKLDTKEYMPYHSSYVKLKKTQTNLCSERSTLLKIVKCWRVTQKVATCFWGAGSVLFLDLDAGF